MTCPRCAHHSLTTDGLCERCNLPIQKDSQLSPKPFRIAPTITPEAPVDPLHGRLCTYTWPTGESAMVLVTTPPDEDDRVGITVLVTHQRVPMSDVRLFTDD